MGYATDPIAEQVADFSMTGYADDVFQKALVEQADLGALRDKIERVQVALSLSAAAAPFGHSRNDDKTAVIPVCVGRKEPTVS